MEIADIFSDEYLKKQHVPKEQIVRQLLEQPEFRKKVHTATHILHHIEETPGLWKHLLMVYLNVLVYSTEFDS